MRGSIAGVAMLAFAAACSQTEATKNGVATDQGIAAIALPEEQYRDLLKRSVLATHSGPMHLYQLGLGRGCEVLNEAVDATVDRNLPAWRDNLIAAYRANVPPDELAKAVEESPRRGRTMLESYIPAIGAAMQERSAELLKRSGVEVLERTGEAAAKVDPARVDPAARQKELAAMAASGEICGVGKWQQQ